VTDGFSNSTAAKAFRMRAIIRPGWICRKKRLAQEAEHEEARQRALQRETPGSNRVPRPPGKSKARIQSYEELLLKSQTRAAARRRL